MADFLIHVEGEAVFGMGVDLSVGMVIDSDNPLDSGINVTTGIGSGRSAGIGGGVAFFRREVEGTGGSIDINGPLLSISFYSDDQGFNGGGLTFGKGEGFALVVTEGRTLSIREMAVAISDAASSLINHLVSEFTPGP